MSGDLGGRVALVTGASRGLGASIATALAARGAQVAITARTVGGLEAADDAMRTAGGAPAAIAPADLADPLAVARLVAAVYERYEGLDYLVSCAAFAPSLSPVLHARPEDWVTSLAVNLTAPFQLMRNCGPLLAQSAHGAALFISCAEAQVPQPFYGVYAAPKAAVESLVASYRAELGANGPRVAVYDPGPMATGLRRVFFPGEDQTTLPHPDERAAPAIAALLGAAA